MRTFRALDLLLVLGCVFAARIAVAADDPKADEPKKDQAITLAEGKFAVTAPDKWVRKQPKSRIIEHEFSVPAAEGDSEDGRLTVMGAGGAIEDNLTRWIGQFIQPDPNDIKKDKKTVAGQEVHSLDISGTYKDMPGGPVAAGKSIERPDYRMLAVIIVTKDGDTPTGNYFIKLYGPKKTIAANEAAFAKMIAGLEKK